MKLELMVTGEPVAQPRPKARAFMIGPKKARAQIYNPDTADEWKALIVSAAKRRLPAEPITGPITLTATFFMPRPKGHHNKYALKPSAPLNHEQRPDFDNLVKAVCDALTDAGVWRDDCQVTDAIVRKRWAQKTPGVVIEIETNEPAQQLELTPAAAE